MTGESGLKIVPNKVEDFGSVHVCLHQLRRSERRAAHSTLMILLGKIKWLASLAVKMIVEFTERLAVDLHGDLPTGGICSAGETDCTTRNHYALLALSLLLSLPRVRVHAP